MGGRVNQSFEACYRLSKRTGSTFPHFMNNTVTSTTAEAEHDLRTGVRSTVHRQNPGLGQQDGSVGKGACHKT